jgi:hypothetical protein
MEHDGCSDYVTEGYPIMWETVALEIIKNIVVPELAAYIKRTFETTGQWPTKEELEGKAFLLAEDIKRAGNLFLNRPVEVQKELFDGNT